MAPFNSTFALLFLVNAALTLRSTKYWKKTQGVEKAEATSTDSSAMKQLEQSKHNVLLKRYLIVYLLAAISDWFQGPYVYALYDAYGFSQHVIAILFVAGFGSSMVFGSFIGGLADSFGRRKFTILYTVIYAASCVTKHFKIFWVLMLGRILGGIATSLLFSVFDSWLIRAHSDAGVSSFISKSFSSAAYGNFVVAIVAGLISNKVSSSSMVPFFSNSESDDTAVFFKGGYLNPFDLSLLTLSFCGILASILWEENYGQDQSDDNNETSRKSKSWSDGFKDALRTTINSSEILLCGLICSLFEGSMYVFVFMWTPAMKTLTKVANPDFDEGTLPFGLIFATFMVCCMAGSSTFSILIENHKCEELGLGVFCVATLSFGMMAVSESESATFFSFLVFESCVGMYFPMMGTMKSGIVPENKRVAIYNLYRIPLNFIVLFSLLTDLSFNQSFMLCTAMMGTATLLQKKLIQIQKMKPKSSYLHDDDEEDGLVPLVTPNDSEIDADAGTKDC